VDRLQTAYTEDDPRVILVSVEAVEYAHMRAYFTRLNITHLDLFRDPDDIGASALDVPPPTWFIIDQNGSAAGYMAGGVDWDSPEVRRLIQ
jgi:hypothetical protein